MKPSLPAHAAVFVFSLMLCASVHAQSESTAGSIREGRPSSEQQQQQDMQRQMDARGERAGRRGKRDQAAQAQPAEQPVKYPQAARKEPEAKASAKKGKQLEKLFDAFNAKDSAKVLPLADELIADTSANAYEHAIAARLAGASLLNTDNARALAYLQKAIQYNGLNNNEHYESMLLVSQLQLQEQKYAESLATIDKFLAETKSTDPEQLVVKGNALYRLERYPEAAAVLKQAVEGSPAPKPEWLQLLMGAYADANQNDEAIKVAETIAAKNPADKQTQMNLASVYMQADQDDKAAAILEKVRASGGLQNETDYRNLYAMYINGGKQQQGIDVINEGLQKNVLKPDFATYNALAQAYWFSDQPAKAIEAYQKAAPLAPDGETYLNMARALNNEGRGAEAKEAAKQALAKGVKKPEDANRIIGGK